MADNKYKNFLVNKLDLASIANTGKMSTDVTKKQENQEKLYISVKQQMEADSQKATSPSENISVLMVQNDKTGKASYSPSTIKKYAELKKEGKLPEGISISREPVGKYLEKQFSKYEVDFHRAIQSRDNSNLGLVALYITRVNENNDQVALGMMIELIKNDPNFAFAFRGGNLDLDKLKDLSLMSEADVKVGFDNAEEKEDMTNGKFDSTKMSAKKIDELADDQYIKDILEGEEQTTADFETEVDNAKTSDEVEDTSKNTRRNMVRNMTARIARLNVIRNISRRQREKVKIEEAQAKSEAAIESKAKLNVLKLNSLKRKDKNNNSLENLFNRSSLVGKENDSTTQLEDRTRENREREERAKEEREKIAVRDKTLVKARERALRKAASGRKLNAHEQELIEQDKAERIRLGEQKMKALNTMEQYRAEDSIDATNRVGRESAVIRDKLTIITRGKNDQVQAGNER